MTPAQAIKPVDVSGDSRVARTRADVARAALEVLRREGSDALTHARVAEMAGYSRTTLYIHWPSRLDLVLTALNALGDVDHHEPTGDTRSDLIAELKTFRHAVAELRLDRVLFAMAQWASDEAMSQVRDEINTNAQRPTRRILEKSFQGARLEAVMSMLTGVIACPSMMFGTAPDDDVIEAAVDIVLGSS